MSANRKYAALLLESGLVVIDTKTGKLQRRLETRTSYRPNYAFKPDGTMLASVDGDGIQTWDLTTGERKQSIVLKVGTTFDDTVWVKDNFLLQIGMLSDARVVDLDRRIELWKYSASESGAVYNGQLWMADTNSNGGTFVHLKLPHEAAIAKSQELDPEKLLLIKPGMEVAINVEGTMKDEDRAAIKAALKETLQDNGMKVVDRCSLVLQANVDDTTTVKYSTLNAGVGRMHMGARVSGTVSSGKYELAFEDSG